MRALTVAAAICGLVLVAAGAIGAHMVPIEARDRWDGALLYGFVHTLAALAAALLPTRGQVSLGAGWAFIVGVLLFSGIQIAKAMTSSDGVSPLDGLTMLVPIGGIAFMAGWGLLGLAALLGGRVGEKP
ncbi:MAG: DUF423 domain-containing protein [Hyphomonadaceae bacterium]|nr:DUF423 domain-containing protein [Hyphomonadaceae bacterium]